MNNFNRENRNSKYHWMKNQRNGLVNISISISLSFQKEREFSQVSHVL